MKIDRRGFLQILGISSVGIAVPLDTLAGVFESPVTIVVDELKLFSQKAYGYDSFYITALVTCNGSERRYMRIPINGLNRQAFSFKAGGYYDGLEYEPIREELVNIIVKEAEKYEELGYFDA